MRGQRNFFVGALRSKTSSGMTRADGMAAPRRTERQREAESAVGCLYSAAAAAQQCNVLAMVNGQHARSSGARAARTGQAQNKFASSQLLSGLNAEQRVPLFPMRAHVWMPSRNPRKAGGGCFFFVAGFLCRAVGAQRWNRS